MPGSWRETPPAAPPARARLPSAAVSEIVPADEKTSFDVKELIDALVDAESFCEVHARWAKELVVGYARLDGRAIGIVANQPKFKGGVLFVDSADKAARFIATCNAFNIPLLFLADVPGFMIGTEVERQGIIRHGAKMISAVSEATVPKISVIVRKAYGAGPLRDGRARVRARLLHRPADGVDRRDGTRRRRSTPCSSTRSRRSRTRRSARSSSRAKREEYSADIDILHLASELVVDAVIEPDSLRAELIRRFGYAEGRDRRLLGEAQPDHARLVRRSGAKPSPAVVEAA